MGPDNSLTVESITPCLMGGKLSFLVIDKPGDKPARLNGLEERHLDRQALELSREKFLYMLPYPREISPGKRGRYLPR